jgi:hypothetical protein
MEEADSDNGQDEIDLCSLSCRLVECFFVGFDSFLLNSQTRERVSLLYDEMGGTN